jgi:hypothetical protein
LAGNHLTKASSLLGVSMVIGKRYLSEGKGIRTRLWIAVPVLTALITALATYFLARAYVLRQAEANIRDVLLSHRGFHLYGHEEGEGLRGLLRPRASFFVLHRPHDARLLQ